MAAKKPRWVEPVVEQQLSLPGFAVAPPPFTPDVITALAGRKLVEYKLLFALFPEQGDARRINPTVAYLRSLHALKGAPLASDRLHITLATLGSYSSTVPTGVVDNAIVAASRVVWRDIPIVLKEAMTYPESGAFVLTCDTESNARIARLRQWLIWELRKIGLRPEPSSTAHDDAVRRSYRSQPPYRTSLLDCLTLRTDFESRWTHASRMDPRVDRRRLILLFVLLQICSAESCGAERQEGAHPARGNISASTLAISARLECRKTRNG